MMVLGLLVVAVVSPLALFAAAYVVLPVLLGWFLWLGIAYFRRELRRRPRA